MRGFGLSAVKAGITRLRVKGGANQESLYDLLNGYVTAARTIAPRPGSKNLLTGEFSGALAGTIGLTLFNGVFQVFASSNVGPMPEGYNLNILTHPSNPDAELVEIWFAEPYMGLLYVVAEWDDNPDIAYHYWLEESGDWEPDTIYRIGDLVQPLVPNGYRYRARRQGEPSPVWAPNVPRQIGDVVEPTTYNGYRYTVIEVYGTNPRSGATEPAWIAADGAAVVEDVDGIQPPNGGGTVVPPVIPPGYGNPGGNLPGGGGQNFDTGFNQQIQ